ncbi:MAG TPA: hypothetical protein VJH20_04835 [Candidatus Nanoarchaeia archaeon]|nr:hypothetical protein [Candidatus Nanoarchaeia archaeon]
MKTKKFRKIKENILASLLAGTVLFGANSSLAQKAELSNVDLRINSGYKDNGSESHKTKTIFSIADDKTYEGRRYGPNSQFADRFRLVNITFNNQDYTSIGARIYSIPGLEIVEGLYPYASFGDQEGLGLETLIGYNSAKLTLNVENRTSPTSASHFGAGLDYRINDSIMIGGAIDRIDDNGSRNQYLLTTEIRLSPTDTFGGAGIIADNNDGSRDNGVGGFWIHYGKDEKWGVRARSRADWNDERNQRSFESEVIFAEKPTTGEPGATWTVGRNIRDDEMYHQGIIPTGINITFGVPLMDRAKEGYSALAKGKIQNDSGENTGYIKGAIANIKKYYISQNIELGYSIGATNNFNEKSKDNTTIDLEGIMRARKTTLNPSLNIDVGNGNVFGGVNLTLKF